MASGLFDTTRNFSFYAVPAAWICAFIPHAYAAFSTKSFDNRSPRTYSENLAKDQTLDQATKDRILRAEGAQTNGFENLPLFVGAILAGNLASLPAATMNTFTAAYLGSRVLYNLVYINNTSEEMANVRSGVFLSGVIMCMSVFVMSGNVLRNGVQNLL